MKLEWMGKYRPLIGELMRFGNVYSRAISKTNAYEYDIEIKVAEWQVLEITYEHQDTMCNMAFLANKLGIPQSNFSKYVKNLCELGLIDRYYRQDNNKDIVLRLSERGKEFYLARVAAIDKTFQEAFESLKDIPDQYMDDFVEFLKIMTNNSFPYINKSYERTDALRKI